MKFTPETLIQIYLDGSFTEEAQAEFDTLMRRDPAFAERVIQALAERLGPVPDATVDNLSARLDGKIGDIWNRHKPSPLGQALKLGLQVTLGLAAATGFFFAGRFGLVKLHPGALSVLTTVPSQNPAGMPQVLNMKSNQANGKPWAGVSTFPAPAPSSVQAGVSFPAQAKGENSLGSTRASAVLTLPAQSLAQNVSSAGTTMEGNSLRVDIQTDSTQNVTVTVYDANGLLVKHLFNGMLAAGEHSVDWDGKSDSGNVVLPGDYTVILDRGGKKMSGLLKVLPSR